MIGDRAMTEDEGRNIDEDREENESYLKQYEKDEDRDRIRINAKNRGCIKDLEREIFVKPKWDVYKNDQFSLRQRYMDLFLKAANTILTRIRADKRLRLIKQKFEEATIYIYIYNSGESEDETIVKEWWHRIGKRHKVKHRET